MLAPERCKSEEHAVSIRMEQAPHEPSAEPTVSIEEDNRSSAPTDVLDFVHVSLLPRGRFFEIPECWVSRDRMIKAKFEDLRTRSENQSRNL